MTSLLAAALLAAALEPQATPGVSRAFHYMMGTSVSIQAVGRDEPARAAAIEQAFAAIAEVDRLMSNYRDDSELSRVNKDAASGPVPVSDATLAVLAAAERVSRASEGAFDVTVGPLMRLWGFHDKKPHKPTAAELEGVRPLINYRNVTLDAQARSVRFARQGVELDLGGIAKGFAVELAAGVLRDNGLAGAVDAGGNQYFVGAPPGKTAWSVGIEDPERRGELIGTIDVKNGSLSTSGGYSNFLVIDGTRYGHILDPKTLQPCAPNVRSVTVVATDGTLADALSKPSFVMGAERGLKLIESFAGAAGVVAYQKADGKLGVLVSESLRGVFHPAPHH